MNGTQELELPPRAQSAREARRWVGARLEELGLKPLAEQVELLTTELVTNALLHAGTSMSLRVEPAGDGVRVEVEDGSHVVPSRRHYSVTATTGRGMTLLQSLSDDFGWRSTERGKVTWFVVTTVRSAWDAFELDDVIGGS